MKKKIILSSLFALSLFALPLTACNEEGGSVPSGSVATATISIKTPSKTSFEVGESETLEAELLNFPEGTAVNWYSSNTAVISISQKGKINALAEGTSEITCKAGEVTSAPLVITVTPKKVPSITLKEPSKSEIEVNEEIQLTFDIKNTDQTNVTFVANNDNVSITSAGVVKGLKVGTSKIHAELGEIKSNEITLTILEESKELTVAIEAPSKKYLVANGTYRLVSKVKGNVNNYPLEYVSSNPAVLSVNDSGMVTALAAGVATITLKVHDVTSDPVEFTVLASYSPVESVSYEKTSIEIVKGESFTFTNVMILPETADQSFTLTSSDSKYVSVDGDTITGLNASDDSVLVTIHAGGKEAFVAVTVKSAFDAYVPSIKAKLQTADQKEATMAKQGHLYFQDQDATGKDTTYDKYDFVVNSDNRSVTRHKKKSQYSSGDKNERISFTYYNDDLIQYTESFDDDDNPTGTPDVLKKDVVESEGGYTEVDKPIALNAVNYPYVGSFDTNSSKCGFAKYILNNYFNSTFFGTSNADNKNSFQYSKALDGEVYTLKMDSVSSYAKKCIELTLSFNNDLLVSVNGKLTNYDIDWDDNVTLEGYTIIDGVLESGTREVSTGLFDPDSMYLTGFDAEFYTGYGSNKKVGTEFAPGVNVSFNFINTLPSTYNAAVDTGYLTVDEQYKSKVTITGNYITANEEIEDLPVTIHAAKLSKTFHLKFAEQKTKTLTYDGTTKTIAGDSVSCKVKFDKNTAIDIVYSITSSNADKATITKGSLYSYSGYQTFTFNATEAGTYSIKAHDNKSGLDMTQDIVVYENSDAGIVEYLGKVKPQNYGSVVTKPTLVKNDDSSFTLSFLYQYDCDWETATDTITANFNYSDGTFTLVSSTSKSGVIVKTIGFESGHSSLRLTFDYPDDGTDYTCTPVTISLK